MQRRKYLAAIGSMAAAGGAVMGTGAFETSGSRRTTEVRVAPDSSGYVEISALNETYASGTGSGQLTLNFDEEASVGIFDGDAQGLNANSTFEFDEVFRVANIAGLGDMRVVIRASGFDLERLELTANGEEATAIESGTSLRAADYDSVDALPKLVEPDAVDVDIEIETGDDTGNVGGTLTIHTATGGNREDLSDVL